MNGTGMSSPTYSPLPPASSTSPLLTHSNTPSITPSPSISETPTMIEMQQQNAGMTMGETQETETMMITNGLYPSLIGKSNYKTKCLQQLLLMILNRKIFV